MSKNRPCIWVFAGPNGAGKSTLMRHCRVAERMLVVNADDIAADLRLKLADKSEAAIIALAGRHALAYRNRLLNEASDFAVETTLTGHSELRLIQDAAAAGYRVNFVYVRISNPNQSNSRVVSRVKAGGHDVPEADIFRRFSRSLANLPRAIALSDSAIVLDNSGPYYKLVFSADRNIRKQGEVLANDPKDQEVLDWVEAAAADLDGWKL